MYTTDKSLWSGEGVEEKHARKLRPLLAEIMRRRGALKSPFFEVDKDGCWMWLRCVNWAGYGILGSMGHNERAHRYFYRNLKKPIPKGLTIDHLCNKPRCLKPEHMQLVSHSENLKLAWKRRGYKRPAKRR